MKKLSLFLFILTLTVCSLSSDIGREIENWAASQNHDLSVGDIQEHLNSSRSTGDITYGNAYSFNLETYYSVETVEMSSDNAFYILEASTAGTKIYKGSIVNGVVSVGSGISYNVTGNFTSDYCVVGNRIITVGTRQATPQITIAHILEVGENTVTTYGPFSLNNEYSHASTVSKINDNTVMFTYNNSDIGYAKIATLDNNTLNWQNTISIPYGRVTFQRVEMLNSTKFAISFRSYDTDSQLGTIAGEINGYNITWGNVYIPGSESGLMNINVSGTHIRWLGEDRYVLIAGGAESGQHPLFAEGEVQVIVLDVNGTTLTYNSSLVLEHQDQNYPSINGVNLIGENHILCLLQTSNQTKRIFYNLLIKGTGIETGTSELIMDEMNTNYIFMNDLPGNEVLSIYTIYDSTPSGRARILSIDPAEKPGSATAVFPLNGETELPRKVTVDWRYDQAGDSPDGFKILVNDAQVADIAYDTDRIYTYVLDNLEYNTDYSWEVKPYNFAGESETTSPWIFTVMDEPANADELPSEVVYFEEKDFSGDNPPAIILPPINLGNGDVNPQADFEYDSAVSNFDVGIRVQDQPDEPLPHPENCGIAFSADFPTGIETTLNLNYGGASTATELVRWNGSEWEDVTAESGAIFPGNGIVTFSWISSARAEEQFAVNGGDDSTLPVELSSFNAVQMQENGVKLVWVTQSESNNLGFNVLRSKINEVTEAGKINCDVIPGCNSSSENTYDFTDQDVEYEQRYFYWLESIDLNNNCMYYGPVDIFIERDKDEETPEEFTRLGIQAIYPNPFNPATNINYSVKHEGLVEIAVFNLKGQKVKTLVSKVSDAGDFSISWHGDTDNAEDTSSGVYFIRMNTENHVETRKIIMIK